MSQTKKDLEKLFNENLDLRTELEGLARELHDREPGILNYPCAMVVWDEEFAAMQLERMLRGNQTPFPNPCLEIPVVVAKVVDGIYLPRST